MKLNKMMTSLAAVAVVNASAIFGTGCMTTPEYKIVERVTKDGTVEKCVVEKSFMDKVNDVGVQNAGTLRLLEVGGQYGFGIWNGIQGERQISAIRGISSAVKGNTRAVNSQTSTIKSGFNSISEMLKNQSKNKSNCNDN